MALSDDTINRYADACTPNTETGALNYKAFASVIEAAVRKQDDALIRQLVEALGQSSPNTDASYAWQSESWVSKRAAAIAAGRSRLKEIAQ